MIFFFSPEEKLLVKLHCRGLSVSIVLINHQNKLKNVGYVDAH